MTIVCGQPYAALWIFDALDVRHDLKWLVKLPRFYSYSLWYMASLVGERVRKRECGRESATKISCLLSSLQAAIVFQEAQSKNRNSLLKSRRGLFVACGLT